MFHLHTPEAYTHTAYTQKENSSICSQGEDTEAQTHIHSRAAKGQGTYCHTHRLKCHTGESGRMAGREELSSQGKICPCRCCLSDLLKRARTHGDMQRKVMDPVTQELERGHAKKHPPVLYATISCFGYKADTVLKANRDTKTKADTHTDTYSGKHQNAA